MRARAGRPRARKSSFGLASLYGNLKIANNFGITKFPENVKAPHYRKFSVLSVGVFTFSGNLVILKLLAIFYSTCRLARPNCSASCPRKRPRAAEVFQLCLLFLQ